MCGLAAGFAYDKAAQAPSDGWLSAVCDVMAARGPDGSGQWRDGRVVLGHRRLAIIDLAETGAQPMLSDDGKMAIVFNGEIYNYRALRAELQQAGVALRSNSDTEVLLHLWRRHGLDMLPRLRGMFAFALWDVELQTMVLARDPFGIKPLYLADDGGVLRVASQVKALLAGGGVDTAPDPAGHAGFLLWGHVPEPFTLYRGIRSLPAGGWMTIQAGGARREGRYFDLGAEIAQARPAAVDVRAALDDTVAHHLVADVPVGLFLSAGIDSCALAGRAGPLETLTLGFDALRGTAADEVPLAEQVAAGLGARHRTAWLTGDDFAACRPAILAAMDQPTVDGLNTWFVARAARQAGLKVALSGVGGDELFGGYDTFKLLPQWERRLAPFRPVPALGRAFRRVTAGWIGRYASPKAAGILELGPNLSDGYLLRRGLFMPWDLPKVLGADMARQGWKDLHAKATLAAAIKGISGDARVMALELSFYLRNQLLRDTDWAGMAHSLEIRTPLVDVGFFRTCLPGLVGPNRLTKADLAVAGGVVSEVVHRRKTGFTVPVSQWLGAGADGSRAWAAMVHAHFTAG